MYIGPLGLIPVLFLLYTFLASGIDSGKNLRPYFLVNTIGLFVLITTSYILIKYFGVFGAIFGAILSRLSMIVVACNFAQRRLRIHYNYFLIILIIILAGSFAIISNRIQDFALFDRMFINIILMFSYPILCVFFISMFKFERTHIINVIIHFKNNTLSSITNYFSKR